MHFPPQRTVCLTEETVEDRPAPTSAAAGSHPPWLPAAPPLPTGVVPGSAELSRCLCQAVSLIGAGTISGSTTATVSAGPRSRRRGCGGWNARRAWNSQ